MSIRTIDVAYDYLKKQKRSVSFKELWNVVIEQMGFNEQKAKNKISQFYTDLSLDGRFASLENNEWDLKSNHKFDEVFIDTANLIDEEDSDVEVEQDTDDLDMPDDDDDREEY